MRKVLSLILLTAFVQGCGDFLNSSSSNKDSQTNPQGKLGNNPFPPGYDPNSEEFSESHMLANIGLNIIYPGVKDLRLQTELLQSKVKTYCDVLSIEGSYVGAEETAKGQWRQTMLSFHKVDAAPVGPMTDDGLFIAQNLYAWPNVNSCTIDVEVEKLARTKVPNRRLLVNAKGLGAVEYLLFSEVDSSNCPLGSPRFANLKKWLEKEEREKKLDRCQFALQLTSELVTHAGSLEEAWDPAGANFSKVMVDGLRYPTVKEAVNDLSDAIFMIEKIKDERLGVPLGLHNSCPTSKCEDQIEHPWSGLPFEAMQARLEGFKQVFFGSSHPGLSGYGFDDDLKSMGREDVAQRMQQAVELAEAQLAKTKAAGSYPEQLSKMDAGACQNTSSEVPLCRLFRSVREISNLMKTDFLTALSLRAPPVFQGDND